MRVNKHFCDYCVFVFFLPCFHNLMETRLPSCWLCLFLWKSQICLLAVVNFIFIIKGCGFNIHHLYLLLERLVLHWLLWLWVALPPKHSSIFFRLFTCTHICSPPPALASLSSWAFVSLMLSRPASIPSSSRCFTHRPHAELTRDQNAARCDDRDETVALRAGRRGRSSLQLTRYI